MIDSKTIPLLFLKEQINS